MDELIAESHSILRLIVARKAMSAASRVLGKTAEERRLRQLTHPTKILRMGATAVCFSAIAAYLRSGSRWEGYRSRYRRVHPKKLVRPIPIKRHTPHPLRKFAHDQFELSLRWAHDMRRLGGRVLASRAMRPSGRRPSFGMIPLPTALTRPSATLSLARARVRSSSPRLRRRR
jgi:hypothetical protein